MGEILVYFADEQKPVYRSPTKTNPTKNVFDMGI